MIPPKRWFTPQRLCGVNSAPAEFQVGAVWVNSLCLVVTVLVPCSACLRNWTFAGHAHKGYL